MGGGGHGIDHMTPLLQHSHMHVGVHSTSILYIAPQKSVTFDFWPPLTIF